jgi:ParB family chromosome partitioning protein
MSRKTVLGKGLDALIPNEPETSQIPAGSVDQLPVKDIIPNPRQPRTVFDAEHLAELAESIKSHGVIQPLVVMPGENGKYILIAGERRLQASKLAGLSEVPTVIREAASDQHLLELALIENVQRADLSPLEMAEAYQALAAEFGLTQEQVAERVGKSRVAVTNTLSLLSMSDAIKQAIVQNTISEGHARAIKGLEHKLQDRLLAIISQQNLSVRQAELLARTLKDLNAEKQSELLRMMASEKLSVEQIGSLAERYQGEKPRKLATKGSLPPEILDLEQRLSDNFATRVNIKHGKGSGRIVLHYASNEEMNALLERLLGEL